MIKRIRCSIVLLHAAGIVALLASRLASAATLTVSPQRAVSAVTVPGASIAALRIRGGSETTNGKAKPKGTPGKTKSKSKSKSKSKLNRKSKKKAGIESKKRISEKLKEKDAAEALGDAIRDRADILRSNDPFLSQIDTSVGSVGAALGASDLRQRMDVGGGVKAASSSIIANYFLKSHGGAHGLQTLCSLLAMASAIGVLVFRQSSSLRCTLLRRAMVFAMIKHVSGLLAAAASAAKAIPKIGLAQSRMWMERLALDPVSQYVFYVALMLLWMPMSNSWWFKQTWVPPVLVGPILLREVVSNLLVLSDVLVLSTVGKDVRVIKSLLRVSQSLINAGMSLVVSPQKWRSAKPRERQIILAKLVSRISLIMEVLVGLLLCADFVRGFVEFAFSSMKGRPSLKETLRRLLCIRLYLHFLWVRRRKVSHLAFKIRGGASTLPFYLLDIVLEPAKSMGIVHSSEEKNEAGNSNVAKGNCKHTQNWADIAVAVLGLEE